MVTTTSVAQVGALVGDPARVAMLQAMMDGRALTATELARAAGVAPQTASGHLSQLATAGMIVLTKQGRHRYHRIATPEVASLLETLMLVASVSNARLRTGPRDEQLRLARTCYDHIAGRLGVSLADAMLELGWIEIEEDASLVTSHGLERLSAVGIELRSSPQTARAVPLCRPCLDWSERRPHLAGRLGKALCAHALELNWIRKRDGSRSLEVTPKGARAFREIFCVELHGRLKE